LLDFVIVNQKTDDDEEDEEDEEKPKKKARKPRAKVLIFLSSLVFS